MFHTYVLASSRRQIDFDRAALLMDDDLLAEAERYLRDNREKLEEERRSDHRDYGFSCEQGICKNLAAYIVFRKYCKLHLERYGHYFEPDVSESWDA